MVADRQSRFTFLAADLLSAAQPSPTPLPKTRVGGFRRHASGRLSRRGHSRSMFTPGSRTCAYKTASGLGKWPNRDPMGERGFEILRQHNAYRVLRFVAGIAERAEQPDLYEFVANNPVKFFDSLGLDPNSPQCQALQAQLNFHSAVAAYDESFGNYQGWAEEAAICMELGQMMQEAGCFDPPPPPPAPTCPAPAPAPPSRGFNPPRGFWPIVGIGIGIGIGCAICPECCAIGVLAGA